MPKRIFVISILSLLLMVGVVGGTFAYKLKHPSSINHEQRFRPFERGKNTGK
ncbi:hypothetical protein LSG31_10100 [Fodinisporobacter ferrooxydans]|uniref:Uncharacterized protein n=1 Tax=Fodinisporobacter ferrooxydans TaxID=2901836 RepID=A0ABY4CPP6_9BACL|nr:hypothetical protein LSG31_10100 [Alicyclobacillaceae bacterium MYW30-H2]